MDNLDPYRPAAFGADYQLTGFPRDEAGNLLYTSGKGEEYDAYLSWLADYLVSVEAKPSARQEALCERYRTVAPAAAMGSLGMWVAEYQDYREEIRSAVDAVQSGPWLDCSDAAIQAVRAELASWWEEQAAYDEDEDDDEDGEEADADENERTLPTEDDIRVVIGEMRQLEANFAPATRDFLDLGWRVPLAQILKCIPDREERVRLLDEFFTSYREEAGK